MARYTLRLKSSFRWSTYAASAVLLLTGAAPPIVFITAYDDRVARERACRASAVDYLRKPFDDETLLDAINRAIRGS